MQHVFLLGKEGFNYFNTQIYNIINDIVLNTENTYYVSDLSLKNRLSKNNLKNVKHFNVSLPKLGILTYFLYDSYSLYRSFIYILCHRLSNCSIILFSSRSGLFLPFFKPFFKKNNISLLVYNERDDLLQNKFSMPIRILFNLSEYMAVKYADTVLYNKQSTKNYLLNNYKQLDFNLSYITYSNENANKNFEDFLNSFNLKYYGYYLFIDDGSFGSNIIPVVKGFLRSDTKKNLVILAQKGTLSHKYLNYKEEYLKDKRIIYLNIKRYIHLIPSISKHCYGFIHSNWGKLNQQFLNSPLKDEILNIVFDSPYNKKISLSHVLYYNRKNLSEILEYADSYESVRKNKIR